jgi:hypothetical protein
MAEKNPKPSDTLAEDGQTGRHGEANSRFAQFCENAQKYRNIYFSQFIV